jgi:hypothetical protein
MPSSVHDVGVAPPEVVAVLADADEDVDVEPGSAVVAVDGRPLVAVTGAVVETAEESVDVLDDPPHAATSNALVKRNRPMGRALCIGGF